MSDARDYRDTVFLPKTDFPMKAGLPQKEPGILAKWEADGLYHRLREARAGREKFILHDGPPYANGDMHIGHALNHILKDMVCRTQSLLGKDAPYVPGWDCHGLPIEWKVEEQYRKKKLNKDEVPVKEFRAECRAYAQHWVNVQREQVKRLGVLGHWDKPYLTMDFDSEATIVSELLKFAESGQLYRGAKPVMWSPVEKTALAEAEVEYEDITSTQIDVAFKIRSGVLQPSLWGFDNLDQTVQDMNAWLEGASFVIWTTTPWTIPVNQALAIGEKLKYALLETERGKFIVAADLVKSFCSRAGFVDVNVRYTVTGSEFCDIKCEHPMAGKLSGAQAGFFNRDRPLLIGDFVTTDSGTGLVHMAPDHGEDDFDLCKAHGIEPQFAVEADGKYRADWAWLGGQGSVINPKFNAPDGPICSDLREAGALLAASADYQHSYPHSWRSKAKVIYRCTPQWFVPMDRPQADDPNSVRAEPVEALPLTSSSQPGEKTALRQAQGERSGGTLRGKALSEINRVRFVPEKGRNRIGSMVEGRPDWVLSRQRAWGVPITLFVDRKTGQYLNDPAVNARIVAAVREEGVDAWEAARAQEYLGDAYRAEDYEQVFDILDVWFDSGCTHVFTLESGKWPELQWPADLYLEGSDQHRGWFQSSLLQSCGTRGRAPYNAVLTHGFTMDAKGKKMSKSEGNTVDPLKVMETNGADIIRLWALSVDFTEDHRIGDEILKGVADQYRKLRNTFRYLLGALDGFSDAEKVAVADMPELERYILHLLADMDAKLRVAVNDFDYNSYVRLISDFANNDLSAFFFDIRKDSLYCDAETSLKRRSYRTVLDILFHALVRWAAPVLVFTSEEVWGTRFPDAGSVHLLDWPELPFTRHPVLDTGSGLGGQEGQAPGQARGDDLVTKWRRLRMLREGVTNSLEIMRRDKEIGSSLEAEVSIELYKSDDFAFAETVDLAELMIVSSATSQLSDVPSEDMRPVMGNTLARKTTHHKCGRCWRHLPEVREDGALCGRCEEVVNG